MEETDRFGKLMLPFIFYGFKKGAEQVKTNRRAFEDFEEQIKIALRRKAYVHAGLAMGTTKEAIQKLLAKALAEGWGVQELGRKIDGMYAVLSRTNALRIARTELTGSINYGVSETLYKEGHTEKEWSTVIDGQERPTHHAVNGQTIPISGYFKVGDSFARYPGDDSLPVGELANCRCTLLGAGLTDDRKRALGLRFLRVHGSLEKRFVLALRAEFIRQKERVLSHFPS